MIQIPHSHVASGVTKDDEISKHEEVDIFSPGIIKTRRKYLLSCNGCGCSGKPVAGKQSKNTEKDIKGKTQAETTCIRIRREENRKRRRDEGIELGSSRSRCQILM